MTDFSFIYLYTSMSFKIFINFFLSWNKGTYVWHFLLIVLKWSMELMHSVPNLLTTFDTMKEKKSCKQKYYLSML